MQNELTVQTKDKRYVYKYIKKKGKKRYDLFSQERPANIRLTTQVLHEDKHNKEEYEQIIWEQGMDTADQGGAFSLDLYLISWFLNSSHH